MKDKKNFVLRIDSETYQILEKWAGDEFRSVNGQIEYILHQAMLDSGRKVLAAKSRATQDLQKKQGSG
ncbi:MAG: Arc family DNA binding domain-containing protein [Sphingobacteriales bacterium 41-5]|nr:MAG: Arc family DNA binding domain-containing protein [Sphingobacteriales bacterium 41-5]